MFFEFTTRKHLDAFRSCQIEDVNAAHFERLLRVIYTDTCFIGDRCAVERTVNIQHSRVQIPLPLPIFSLTVLHLSSEILDLLVLGKRFQGMASFELGAPFHLQIRDASAGVCGWWTLHIDHIVFDFLPHSLQTRRTMHDGESASNVSGDSHQSCLLFAQQVCLVLILNDLP